MGSCTEQIWPCPKSKDDLELSYQRNELKTVNADNVITATLVDDIAMPNEVDEHDGGDEHDGVDECDNDDHEEDELG